MSDIKIGIVGSGYMAGVHAKSLAKMSDVVIEAICDPFVKPDELMKTHGIQHYFDDFKTMIDASQLDAIVLTIPPFAHGGEVEYAAEKGVSVFLEKPISLTLERAESMATAVKQSGVKSMVGYMMRYGAAVTKLKAMIDSGEAGTVTLFDARYECNSLHTPWWRVQEKSGGQILEQIIHLYDLSLFLMGTPESAVGFKVNLCHQDVEGYTVEDTSSGIIRFKSGAIASISGTNCAVPMTWGNPFSIVCQNVTVHFKDANHAEFIDTRGEEPVTETISCEDDLYFAEMQAFVDLLRGADITVATIQDGLTGFQMVNGVTNSNGQQIKL
ncbi:MAG: Gfo/Idh/MocA family oxidoreductase [Clostridia bacterium]